jgi:hypothetical protein
MPTSTAARKTPFLAGKRAAPRRAAVTVQTTLAPAPAPITPRKAVNKSTARAAAPAGVAAAKAVATPKPLKIKNQLVRDSFTMPQSDFDLIARLKERALGFKRPTKKSELLRAGLQVLQGLDDELLHTALNALVPLKPGRPKAGG